MEEVKSGSLADLKVKGLEDTEEKALEEKIKQVKEWNFKKKVLPLFHSLQLEKGKYMSNHEIKTSHKTRIEHINMSPLSKYLTSASSDKVIIWKNETNTVKEMVSIPLEKSKLSNVIMAAVDQTASICVIYTRSDTKIHYYDIDIDAKKFTEKQSLELGKKAKDIQYLSEIKFYDDSHVLKCTQ